VNRLSDEQGKGSTARAGFWAALAETLVIIPLDATVPGFDVPTEAYALLGSVIIACAAWAGGRAAMQYLGPQIGRVASGIASAKKDTQFVAHQWNRGNPDEGIL
jgi:hypothetical protein